MIEFNGTLLKRAIRDQRGTAAIEFAFIGSLLLIVLTIGTFEAGRFLYMYNKLSRAAGEVTRQVAIGTPDDSIKELLMSRFEASERAALMIDMNPSLTDAVSYKLIDITYRLPLVLPGFNLLSGSDAVTVHVRHLIPTN
jgi:hypothetical protein